MHQSSDSSPNRNHIHLVWTILTPPYITAHGTRVLRMLVTDSQSISIISTITMVQRHHCTFFRRPYLFVCHYTMQSSRVYGPCEHLKSRKKSVKCTTWTSRLLRDMFNSVKFSIFSTLEPGMLISLFQLISHS